MVRYLLQHVYKAVKCNRVVFSSFLDVLDEVDGGLADEIRRELHKYELAELVGESLATLGEIKNFL